MNDQAFRFVALDEAAQLYGRGYRAAVREIATSADLRQRLEMSRRQAASRLPLPPDLRRAYEAQVPHSESAVRQGDFTLLQRHEGRFVPLVRQDLLGVPRLPAAPSVVLPSLLDPTACASGVLDAIREIPDPNAHLDLVDGSLVIFAPDMPTMPALMATLHEVGHYLYEVQSGRSVNLGFAHYVESEAAAMTFCRRGIRRYLELHPPYAADGLEAYQSAEMLLNHYFFLEEAGRLGFHSGHLPPMAMPYLRDNWMKQFGYQIVYAAASQLAVDHATDVLTARRPS
ncbi:hypothetical protein [Amycolatopsis vastitatis]|uniref:Uncharacterized protein n=1 Tax=Amycolatopsis vastitatis TaxID=1905142 RepID=A0A229TB54_9PSEU|nr:hypothetical protein [Amycolatopsis vastitatis]OXM68487.1 hypothetical protein CF165_13345 [Amycolatopsis vastitatis]